MAVMENFGKLSAKFSHCADFQVVYIEEAHPSERPNFTGNVDIQTHKNLEDRVRASKMLDTVRSNTDKFNITVDLMDNQASVTYAALPERLYVVLDGEIIYEGGQGPFDYHLEELESLLESFKSKPIRQTA